MWIMDTFYDKVVDIYSIEITKRRWADVKNKTLLYESIRCEYYIATRGNVVNWQPSLWDRQQDLDRIDLVIPWSEYDITKKIKAWYYIVTTEWDSYIIDQIDYYRMPDWTLESIYVRLNQKWK